MSENIIPASEEETAAKGFSETEIVANAVLFILARVQKLKSI